MKRRYLIIGSVLLFLSLLIVSLSDKLLKQYALLFHINNATKGADCILILSGNAQTRPDHAAILFKEGYAKKLYHTDQKIWNQKYQELFGQDFNKSQAVLATYNLSADIIPSTKGGATSTFDEAYDFVQFLRSNPMRHVILVTDAFHTSRAHYAFRKVLDANGHKELKVEMSAAPNDIFNEENWYTTEDGISAYVFEPIKYLFYIFNTTNSTLIQER